MAQIAISFVIGLISGAVLIGGAPHILPRPPAEPAVVVALPEMLDVIREALGYVQSQLQGQPGPKFEFAEITMKTTSTIGAGVTGEFLVVSAGGKAASSEATTVRVTVGPPSVAASNVGARLGGIVLEAFRAARNAAADDFEVQRLVLSFDLVTQSQVTGGGAVDVAAVSLKPSAEISRHDGSGVTLVFR